MTTINLYQNQEEGENRASSRGVNGGFFFSLGILIITLIVLFGLKFYIPTVEAQNKKLEDTIINENSQLVGLKNLEQLVDMQKRLGEIRGNLQINDKKVSRIEMTQVLDKLGLDMSKGIVVSNYKYENGKVVVSFDANNFNDASKQILSFKKSEYFTNAKLASISRGEKKIACNVEMEIKK